MEIGLVTLLLELLLKVIFFFHGVVEFRLELFELLLTIVLVFFEKIFLFAEFLYLVVEPCLRGFELRFRCF